MAYSESNIYSDDNDDKKKNIESENFGFNKEGLFIYFYRNNGVYVNANAHMRQNGFI